jgi:hypothetical protein
VFAPTITPKSGKNSFTTLGVMVLDQKGNVTHLLETIWGTDPERATLVAKRFLHGF